MKRALFTVLVGVLVTIAGCTQLLSPASNLRTIPLVEGGADAEVATLDALDSASGKPSQVPLPEESDLPDSYSLIITPLPNQQENLGQALENLNSADKNNTSLPQIVVPLPTATTVAASRPLPSQPPTNTSASGTGNIDVPTPNPVISKTATPIPTYTPVPINSNSDSDNDEQSLELAFDSNLIGVGEEVGALLQLSNAPDGLSGFDIVIEIEDSNVAEFLDASLPNYGLASISDLPASTVQIRAVDLGGNISSTLEVLELGSVVLRGRSVGATEFSFTIKALDDDSGLPMRPRIVAQEIIVR